MSKPNTVETKQMRNGDIRVVLYTPQGAPIRDVITTQEFAERVAAKLMRTAEKYYA